MCGRGESIVDLTWATPSTVHLMKSWRMAEMVAEMETLSDHRRGDGHSSGGALLPPGIEEN